MSNDQNSLISFGTGHSPMTQKTHHLPEVHDSVILGISINLTLICFGILKDCCDDNLRTPYDSIKENDKKSSVTMSEQFFIYKLHIHLITLSAAFLHLNTGFLKAFLMPFTEAISKIELVLRINLTTEIETGLLKFRNLTEHLPLIHVLVLQSNII